MSEPGSFIIGIIFLVAGALLATYGPEIVGAAFGVLEILSGIVGALGLAIILGLINPILGIIGLFIGYFLGSYIPRFIIVILVIGLILGMNTLLPGGWFTAIVATVVIGGIVGILALLYLRLLGLLLGIAGASMMFPKVGPIVAIAAVITLLVIDGNFRQKVFFPPREFKGKEEEHKKDTKKSQAQNSPKVSFNEIQEFYRQGLITEDHYTHYKENIKKRKERLDTDLSEGKISEEYHKRKKKKLEDERLYKMPSSSEMQKEDTHEDTEGEEHDTKEESSPQRWTYASVSFMAALASVLLLLFNTFGISLIPLYGIRLVSVIAVLILGVTSLIKQKHHPEEASKKGYAIMAITMAVAIGLAPFIL